LVFDNKVGVFLSEEIFIEYINVLYRPKFSAIPNFRLNAEIALSRLKELSKIISPEKRVNMIADQNDNRFLELALASGADFLITGNTNDFNMKEFGVTRIVTPSEYWSVHFKP